MIMSEEQNQDRNVRRFIVIGVIICVLSLLMLFAFARILNYCDMGVLGSEFLK